MVSNYGRYGVVKKQVISGKSAYSKFGLPNSIVIGDKFDVPVTVYNNFEEDQLILV